MADSTTHLDTISVQQSDPALPANGNFDASSGAMTFGRRQSQSGGLDWAWYGGRVNGTVVPNGSLTLNADAVNYITVNRSTLAVSVNVSGYNWCDPVTHARLYRVTHASGVVTYEDHRFGRGGIFDEGVGGTAQAIHLPLPVNQPGTALATGNGQAYIRAPFPGRLARIRAAVATASSSGLVTCDLRNAGLSVFGPNKLTIDANELTSTTAATAHDVAEQMDIVAADDELISLNVDGAGTGTAGLRVGVLLLPFQGDQFRDCAALILTMQGANAGTTFTDASTFARTVTRIGDVTTSTAIADPWGGALSTANFGSTGTKGFRCAWDRRLNFRGVDFDIGVWLRFSSYGCTILDCRGDGPYSGGSSSWAWYVSGDRKLGIWDAGQSLGWESSANAVPVANTWFHARLTRRGSTSRLYVDGTQVATSGSWNPSNTLASGIRVLHGDAGDSSTFKGNARDFVILHSVSRFDGAHQVTRRAYIP